MKVPAVDSTSDIVLICAAGLNEISFLRGALMAASACRTLGITPHSPTASQLAGADWTAYATR